MSNNKSKNLTNKERLEEEELQEWKDWMESWIYDTDQLDEDKKKSDDG